MLKKYEQEQPIAIKILNNTLKRETISHAYLFITNNYIEAINLVKDFAKEIIVKDIKDLKIKNQIITMINNEVYLDLKIIEPDGLWIKKNQTLDLQKEFSLKTNQNFKKVYIIKDAEKLNQHAANSILKFLEEPEENIYALLICENSNQMLETIKSRCIQINLTNNLTKSLNNLGTIDKIKTMFELEEEDLNEFIKNTFQILINVENFSNQLILNSNDMLKIIQKDRLKLNLFFDLIILIYKDIINNLLANKINVFTDYKEEIKILTKTNTIKTVIKKMNKTIKYKERIKYNANINLLMEKLILNIGDVCNE